MSVAAYALVSIEDALQYTQAPPESEPDLERYVNAASEWYLRETDRKWRSTAITGEVLDGSGCYEIEPRYWPVTAFTKLETRVLNDWTEQVIPSGGYVIDAQGTTVLLPTIYVPCGRMNVRIAYTAGYTEVPASVVQDVLEMIMDKWKKSDRQAQNIASVSEPGGRSVTYRNEEVPISVRKHVDSLRRQAVA